MHNFLDLKNGMTPTDSTNTEQLVPPSISVVTFRWDTNFFSKLGGPDR